MADSILQTERLTLSPPSRDDLPFLLDRMNTTSVLRHLGGKPRSPENVARDLDCEIAEFAGGGWRRFTVRLRDSAERIGRCGIGSVRASSAPDALRGQPEIGWTLAEQFWGHGYAGEAARAVLSYAFDSENLPLVFAQTSDSNGPSTRLMHRLGFSPRPELGYDDPDYPPVDNPTTVWSLSSGEFERDA